MRVAPCGASSMQVVTLAITQHARAHAPPRTSDTIAFGHIRRLRSVLFPLRQHAVENGAAFATAGSGSAGTACVRRGHSSRAVNNVRCFAAVDTDDAAVNSEAHAEAHRAGQSREHHVRVLGPEWPVVISVLTDVSHSNHPVSMRLTAVMHGWCRRV